MLSTVTTTKTGVASGGSKRFQKYIPCAAEAHHQAEDDAGRREPGVCNPGNLELVYFLRAVKRLEDANEGARSGWATSLYKAARSVGQHPTRIRTAQQLKAVHGIGDFTTKLVSEVLWHEFPPGDPDSEEEQLEDEVRQAAALAPAALTGGGRGRGRGKRAAAGSAAAAAAAALGPHDIPFGDTLVVPVAGADGGDAPAGGIGSGRTRSRGGGGGSGRGAGRGAGRGKRLVAVANAGSDGNGSGDDVVALAPANLNNGSLRLGVYGAGGGLGATAAAGTYGAYGSGVMDGDTAGSGVTVQGVVTAAPERKRARRQSGGPDGAGLAYAPNPGTANYAFLIVMYMAWKRDKRRQWDKDELMDVTQASGLSEKDIRGVKDLSAPGNVSNFYDGWSSFRKLITRDPPLASERTKSKGARGKEFTLTNHGWAMAARLYKSALRYREVQPLVGVTEAQVDEDIRLYCEVEDMVPVFQAYPNGTPTKPRGRAYKGFDPGPRQGSAAAAVAAAAPLLAGAPMTAVTAAAAAPARPRRRQTNGTSSLDGGEDLEDSLATAPGSQPGVTAHGGLGASQGLLGLPSGLMATQGGSLVGVQLRTAMDVGAAAGTAAPGLPSALPAAGLHRPDASLANVFARAGRAFESDFHNPSAKNAAASAAAQPTGIHNTIGVTAGGSVAGGRSQATQTPAAAAAAAAEARAAAVAADAAVQPPRGATAPDLPLMAAAGRAATTRPRTRASPGGARPEVDVVELLDSSDEDDGGDGVDGGGCGDEGNAGAVYATVAVGSGLGLGHASNAGLDTSFAFVLQSHQKLKQQQQQDQGLQPSASPSQDFPVAGSGVETGAVLAAGGLFGLGAAATAAAVTAAIAKEPTAAARPAAVGARVKRARRALVNEADLAQLVEMGFDRDMARKALVLEGGDLSSALDRLDEGTVGPGEGRESGGDGDDDDTEEDKAGEDLVWEEDIGPLSQSGLRGADPAGPLLQRDSHAAAGGVQGSQAQVLRRGGRDAAATATADGDLMAQPALLAESRLRLPPLSGGAAGGAGDGVRPPRAKGLSKQAAAPSVVTTGAVAVDTGSMAPLPRSGSGLGTVGLSSQQQQQPGGLAALMPGLAADGILCSRVGASPSFQDALAGCPGGSSQQAVGSQPQQQPYGLGSQHQSPGLESQQPYMESGPPQPYMGFRSQQPYMGSGSQQQPYRVGSGSQQLDVLGSQQVGGGGGSQDLEGEAGEGSDDRTLCSYEWMLPRVSEVTTNHRALPIRLPPLPPGQRFEDVYDVVLLVDNREPANLLEALRSQTRTQGVRMVPGVSLTVGDFLWVAARKGASLSQASKEHWYVLDAVLERKRTEDLLTSVRDGRYVTQKFRLKRCGLRRLYYLLEESIEGFPALEQKTLRTAVQAGLLEGFTVLRTLNSEDTARQLCMLTRALERQCRGRIGSSDGTAAVAVGGAQDVGEEPLPSYTAWDAGLKNLKQNMKVQAMFGLMLCAVQGMGEERANRVLARYSTPAFLWESYKVAMRTAAAAGRDPVAAAEQLLAGEIGSQCSARLYQLLFSKGVAPEHVVGLPR